MRWTDRASRRPAAPLLDDRDFGDLLAAAGAAAASIGFVGSEGRPEGDWSAILHRDAAILAAVISRHGRSALRARFDARRDFILSYDGRDSRAESVDAAAAEVQAEIALMRRWRQSAGLGVPATEARALFRALDTVLQGDIAVGDQRLSELRLNVGEHILPPEVPHARRLLSVIGAVVDAVEAGQATLALDAEALLAASLTDATHPPAAALHLVFARLFAKVQGAMNAVPDRVAAFHRRDVLGEPPRAPVMDRVQLVLSLPPLAERSRTLPSGTKFAAQGPAGEALVYAAEHALDVTRAWVRRVRMLRRIEAEGALSALLETELTLGPDGAPPLPTPLFGGRVAGDLTGATREAPLGLVIGCPELSMGPGARTVRLILGLSQPPAAGPPIEQCLQFSFSTAEGWTPVQTTKTTLQGDALSIDIDLPAGFAGLVPPVEGGMGAGLPYPAVALRLADPAPPGALTALADVRVSSVRLETVVRSLDGLRVHSNDGDGPPQNFHPFGTPSACGEGFEVTHPELQGKALTRLDIDVTWANLPQQAYGFADYYAQYVVGPDRALSPRLFDNDIFKGDARLIGGDRGLTNASEAPFGLFATYEEAGDTVAQHLLSPAARYGFDVEPASPEEGFLKLRINLRAPAYGFGEDLYVPNILHASNSDQPQRRSWLKALVDRISPERRPSTVQAINHPNQPWRPTISLLTLDYQTARTLSARREADEPDAFVMALGPFEILTPAVPDGGRGWPLFDVPEAGAVFSTELVDVPPAAHQRLLFRLGDLSDDAPPPVVWTTDAGDIHDLTQGLTRSGVLVFRNDPDAGAAPIWLTASLADAPKAEASLLAIGAHTLEAVRLDDGAPGLPAPLPAGSVKGFVVDPPIPVPLVAQPWPSTGGRPGEIDAKDPWLSERMRHKGRADSAWDYERLALDSSLAVGRVRALPATGTPDRPAGRVTIVVRPDAGDANETAVAAEERDALRQCFDGIASPFAEVRVTVPQFVRVGVDAELIFSPDGGPSELAAEIDGFLSGQDAPGGDLIGEAALRQALEGFVAARSYVSGVVSLSLRFDAPPAELGWAAPVGGEHRLFDLSPA